MDWVAGVLELVGAWFTGNKKKWAFLISMAGNAMWVCYVLRFNLAYGLLVVVVPMFFINGRNFLRWWKEEKNVKI
jgi:hypothetical protein